MSIMKTYGPAVLGQELFDKLQKESEGGKDIYGPAVTGYEEPEAEPEDPPPSALSVRALESVLRADPAKLDYYLSAEWDRDGGPRKSALKLFLDLEGEKENPRGVLVERLAEALGQ
ncbi:MAG: hypothetical protein JSW25_07855 [Thermoplasmata archaeon]|nr:MAG: hypothetical protein JSW25_07855 [Thermoplasmata archaeon]